MNTFEELCEWQARCLEQDRTILYELGPNFQKIIIQYNHLGFLTFISQPGSICSNVLYSSAYDRRINPDKIIGKCFRKQRAYIRGYMKSNLTEMVFQRLKNDPYLFVRTSKNNLPIPFEIKLGSVNFVDDLPIQKEEPDGFNEFGPDANWAFNLKLPLRRPFSMMYGKDHPNIDCSDLVEIEIVESRWNENSYLWFTLLSILKEL